MKDNTVVLVKKAKSQARKFANQTEEEISDLILKYSLPLSLKDKKQAVKQTQLQNFIAILFTYPKSNELTLYNKLRTDKDLVYFGDIKLAHTYDQEIFDLFNAKNGSILIFRVILLN